MTTLWWQLGWGVHRQKQMHRQRVEKCSSSLIYCIRCAFMYSTITIAKGASESLTACRTQEGLFRDVGAARSSNCSTSRSFQSLEKSSVAIQQNFFYFSPGPLHWMYCLFFCVMTHRECLLTRVKWTKAEDDPRLRQPGAPEAAEPWQSVRQRKEQSEAADSLTVIMDSHIRSIKVWWEMGCGSSLAGEVERTGDSMPDGGRCWRSWRLPGHSVAWKHVVWMSCTLNFVFVTLELLGNPKISPFPVQFTPRSGLSSLLLRGEFL